MGRPSQLTCPIERNYRRVCHKRFSKLLHERIGCKQGVKAALGPWWSVFVREARHYGKPRFIRAFNSKNVCCRGPLDGNGFCTGPEVQCLGDIEADHR